MHKTILGSKVCTVEVLSHVILRSKVFSVEVFSNVQCNLKVKDLLAWRDFWCPYNCYIKRVFCSVISSTLKTDKISTAHQYSGSIKRSYSELFAALDCEIYSLCNLYLSMCHMIFSQTAAITHLHLMSRAPQPFYLFRFFQKSSAHYLHTPVCIKSYLFFSLCPVSPCAFLQPQFFRNILLIASTTFHYSY